MAKRQKCELVWFKSSRGYFAAAYSPRRRMPVAESKKYKRLPRGASRRKIEAQVCSRAKKK